jgi:signal transduction histidine kinase
LAALLIIFFGMRYIIRPLQDLEREAQRVARGDLDAIQRPVGGVEEIESLQRTLNQMTTQIRAYQTALQDYLTALTRAEEEERRRVARELHDETVQTIIALIHRLEKCERAIDSPEQLACRLEDVRSMATQALDDARRLIYNLRPPYLEDLGLVAAVETLGQDVARNDGSLSVRTEILGEAARLAPELELAAFRILQEALNNVVRHAKAGNVDVRVDFGKTGLTLTVRDDGIGFVAPQGPQDLARDGHFGLMGMRERALRFGGCLAVQSRPGEGTTLVVTLPYHVPLTTLQ